MKAKNSMTQSFHLHPGKLVFPCIRPFPARFLILFGFLIRHAVLSIEHVDKKLKNRFFNVSGKREYPGFPHPALQRIFQCERRIKGEHAVGEWFLEQTFEVFPVFCLWTGAAHACLEGRGA
ncbi:hypothetical protein [Akkermansia sp.]|jgi:hypothetical protein|nr:hypothetical protein [uncultured Akkermansia sp.]